MAATMMAGCGDSDSSTADSKAPAANGGDNSIADVEPAKVDELVNTGKKYNIYVWNTEFKSRFETYYWDQRDTALWDGVEVNWIENTNDGGVYQTKLDEAIAAQNKAADDDKIDMFLVEADYALKYVNSDAPLDVIGEVGLTKDDLSQQYKYTQDVMTDSKGTLKGVSWQATPGLFLYNAKYARDVLGTDDPTEVQAKISNWDDFEAVAAQMKEKDIAMVSGFADTYRCFSNNVSAPWVTDGKITIDPQISAWVEQTKKWTDNGWNNKTSLWDDAWKAGQKIDGKTFGYFFSTWGIPFTLLPNTVDTALDKGGEAAVGNGGYGEWRACPGPQAYFWGGTWICGCYGSDNIAITRDIMLKLTCDTATMKKITDKEQDYTNNKAAIKELIDGGYKNDFLGGQDHLSLLTEAADKIDLTNKLSAYDQGCNEQFQGAMKDYFLGNSTYDEALANFKSLITTQYGDLTMD
ncbi:MAG: carbohydrate ABC transporter substrate-binding protein [Ruminococcus sp.]|nr:carbohydrate ABC transporter substrate-binding protein [Ruminococcus sp.]MBR1765398.1 carbohydrate ABC transporter substrate-binding protein [Ruminococcus sp.]